MRGIKLGTTLDQFRETPAPTSPDWHDVTLLCYGDVGQDHPDPKMLDDPPAEKTGRLSCHWTGALYVDWKAGNVSAPPRPGHGFVLRRPVQIELGNAETEPTFHFLPDATGALRLFRIHAEAGISWDDVYSPFVEKYGPAKLDNAVVKNGFGATFSKKTATWNNGSSSIIIEEFCGIKPGWICIDYHDLALEKQYKSIIESIQGDPKSRL